MTNSYRPGLPKKARLARVEDHLFRRLFQLNSELNPKVRILALPVEIGPLTPAACFRPLRAFSKRPGAPSRSPIPYEPRHESLKVKNVSFGLWITGISGMKRSQVQQLPLTSPDNVRTAASGRASPSSQCAPPSGSAPAAPAHWDRPTSRSGRRSGRGRSLHSCRTGAFHN